MGIERLSVHLEREQAIENLPAPKQLSLRVSASMLRDMDKLVAAAKDAGIEVSRSAIIRLCIRIGHDVVVAAETGEVRVRYVGRTGSTEALSERDWSDSPVSVLSEPGGSDT